MMKATIEDACFSAGAKIRIDRDTGDGRDEVTPDKRRREP